MVLVGYGITQGGTLIARVLGLTSMSYHHILLYGAIVILSTVAFLALVRFKREITRRFAMAVFAGQTIVYFVMFALWVYRLNEIRIFGLYCALIALAVELAYTNLVQSLVMALGTTVIQIAVTWFAITHGRQQGSFLTELFFALGFIPSFIFISLIAQRFQSQRADLKRSKRELELANETLVLINAELQREKDLSDQEMELATQVQATLLIPQQPDDLLWDVASFYRPRYGVSGDFYDFYFSEGAFAGLSLFDVSGHGVSSALVTILARPVMFRSFRHQAGKDLCDVLEQASRNIHRAMNDLSLYITGIMLRFFDDRIEYVNAGHPDLLVRSIGAGGVRVGGGEQAHFRGRPIGIDISPLIPCKTVNIPIQSGDAILVFSDCLFESVMENGERYGVERVMASFGEASEDSAKDMLDGIMNRFFSSVREADLVDDITVILVRRR